MSSGMNHWDRKKKLASRGKHFDERLVDGLVSARFGVDMYYGCNDFDVEYPYETADGFPDCVVLLSDYGSVPYMRREFANTCHAVHMGEPYNEHYYKCSACGQMWDNNFGRPRFCCWCGSRVIGEDK